MNKVMIILKGLLLRHGLNLKIKKEEIWVMTLEWVV